MFLFEFEDEDGIDDEEDDNIVDSNDESNSNSNDWEEGSQDIGEEEDLIGYQVVLFMVKVLVLSFLMIIWQLGIQQYEDMNNGGKLN